MVLAMLLSLGTLKCFWALVCLKVKNFAPSTRRADPMILVKDLTWSGHDLAAVLENETVWGQFKQRLSPSELVQIPLPC